MSQRTPSIACMKCLNYIHLKKCAKLTFTEAKKISSLFVCQKCNKLNVPESRPETPEKESTPLPDSPIYEFLNVPESCPEISENELTPLPDSSIYQVLNVPESCPETPENELTPLPDSSIYQVLNVPESCPETPENELTPLPDSSIYQVLNVPESCPETPEKELNPLPESPTPQMTMETEDHPETFYLKSGGTNIFVGQLVEKISGSCAKFIIKVVFLREAIDWGYDPIQQTVGCVIMWQMSDVRLRKTKAKSDKGSSSDVKEDKQDDIFVLVDIKDIFEAKLVHTMPGEKCHNRPIPNDSLKFEITKLISKTWEHINPDIHSVGSYIVWKKSNTRRRNEIDFYNDDGEGIMGDHAKTYEELGLKHGSKRKKNPIENKSTKTKRQKNDEKQKTFIELNIACSCKKLRCYDKVDELSDQVRKKFRHEYYELDVNRRRDMIIKHVIKTVKSRCTTDEPDSKRDFTFKYYISTTQVCKTMFLATLGISEQVVRTAFIKCKDRVSLTSEEDKRGGNRKRKIDEREVIKEHIKMFPTKDSHYCRKQTNKRFLHEQLTIPKMFKMYVTWCKENGHHPQHQYMYNEVFQTEFNLSFFKRKNDKCSQCNAFEGRISSKQKLKIIFREEEQLAELTLDELKFTHIFLVTDPKTLIPKQ